MARIRFNQARMSTLIRENFSTCRAPKQVRLSMSKLAGKDPTAQKEHYSNIKGGNKGGQSSWVPHPRTGIYYPAGHEWVMDDVPDDAASFVVSHWLRNTDGVDRKPEAGACSAPYESLNLMQM